jgi:hypothetical protein
MIEASGLRLVRAPAAAIDLIILILPRVETISGRLRYLQLVKTVRGGSTNRLFRNMSSYIGRCCLMGHVASSRVAHTKSQPDVAWRRYGK